MKRNLITKLFAAMIGISAVFSGISSAFAAETPDFSQKASLTLEYAVDGSKIASIPVRLYRVADIQIDGDGSVSFSRSGDFSDYPIELSGKRTTEEWDALAQTLYAYSQADSIEPSASGVSGSDGKLVFSDLSCGMYLIGSDPIVYENQNVYFSPALVSLPGKSDGETWSYEQTVFPKGKLSTPSEKEIDYKVVKQWVNSTGTPLPNSVTVQILKNGVVQSTQTLSPDNDWMYSWVAKDDGSVWSVVEKDVPEGYTVTVEGNNTTFLVTNTFVNPPVTPPTTGDSLDLRPLVWVMALTGMGMILFALFRKRRYMNED